MADRATSWAALLGNWQFRRGTATYLGSDNPATPVGMAVSNLAYRGGTLSARLSLPDSADQARIIFGLDTDRTSQFSIGLGGPRWAYYLDDYQLQSGGSPESTALETWGQPSSLAPGAHTVDINLRGQSLDFTVDGVPIFGTHLPRPLRGEQVGAIAVGPGVKFEAVEVSHRTLPRAFVVMSFRSALRDLYDEVIVPVCIESGLEPIRADEYRHPGVILQDIIRGLGEAALVIAEISADEDAAFNANVFYELGYAHATSKPTVLLARKDTNLPFDVSGYRVILYDDSIGGKSAVERELRAHIQNVLGLPLAEQPD